VFFCQPVYVLYYFKLEHGGLDLVGLKPTPLNLSSFDTVGWVI